MARLLQIACIMAANIINWASWLDGVAMEQFGDQFRSRAAGWPQYIIMLLWRFNSLWPSDAHHVVSLILVIIGSSNGLVPVGTKPLLETMLIYHLLDPSRKYFSEILYRIQIFSFKNAGIILCMGSANERRHYIAITLLIGWSHMQNDPWEYVWNCCLQNVDKFLQAKIFIWADTLVLLWHDNFSIIFIIVIPQLTCEIYNAFSTVSPKYDWCFILFIATL